MTRIQSNGGARAKQELEEATRSLHEAQEASTSAPTPARLERGIMLRRGEPDFVERGLGARPYQGASTYPDLENPLVTIG